MNLTERDTIVIAKLDELAAANPALTGRLLSREVVRLMGFNLIALPGHDLAAVEDDVETLRVAVSALRVGADPPPTISSPPARGPLYQVPGLSAQDAAKFRVDAAGVKKKK